MQSSALSLRERVAEGRVRVYRTFRRTTLTRASRTLYRWERGPCPFTYVIIHAFYDRAGTSNWRFRDFGI